MRKLKEFSRNDEGISRMKLIVFGPRFRAIDLFSAAADINAVAYIESVLTLGKAFRTYRPELDGRSHLDLLDKYSAGGEFLAETVRPRGPER
jgi:hypothetical protein